MPKNRKNARRWTTADSDELYSISAWGLGHFGINEAGSITMTAGARPVDLSKLVEDLESRGIELPVLLRFPDVLKARIDRLATTFAAEIERQGYRQPYRGVYPIKVNQQRHLLNQVIRFSAPHHLGLECGSKPELLIVLAKLADPEALIICNGYKDDEYLEMALLSRRLGRNTIIVVEQFIELPRILDLAAELGIEPVIGVRTKLGSRGVGRWKTSSGDRAKFGLTVQEVVEGVRMLRERDQLAALQLLHFHIGSQISSIRSFRSAMREGARVYTELVRMGAPMGFIDVGGGLGVDYDGSKTNFHSSMNYDVGEYANMVVSTVKEACDKAGAPHPIIVNETGRALVAHSSMLVVPVLELRSIQPGPAERRQHTAEEGWDSARALSLILDGITAKNVTEGYHDAVAVRDLALVRFDAGLCPLEERAAIDALYWSICARILETTHRTEELHEELADLPVIVADMAYCNFSLFQSAPDSWAIGQLFPIVPLQRLHQEPTRRAVIADLTCDSDGKINKFIDRRDVKDVLELHQPDGKPYHLGIFLLGAYQEILGDLHNLFGDTNTVLVSAADNAAGYRVDARVQGDRVKDALRYVQYTRASLIDPLEASIERAIEDGTLDIRESNRLLRTYQRVLEAYTYLG